MEEQIHDLLKDFRATEKCGPCVATSSEPVFMVEFRRSGDSLSLPYNLLDYIQFQRTGSTGGLEGIILSFRQLRLTVLGERLEELHRHLLDRRVVRVEKTEKKPQGDVPWVHDFTWQFPTELGEAATSEPS